MKEHSLSCSCSQQ